MTFANLRPGLRIRLIGLVLVPTLVAAVLGASVALDRRHDATVAASVEDGVAVLAELVELHTALQTARVPVEIQLRAGAFGLDGRAGLVLFGIDPSTWRLNDSAVESSLAKLPDHVRPFEAEVLFDLQASIDSEEFDLTVIDDFEAVMSAMEAAIAIELETLEEQAVVLGNTDIESALHELEAITDAYASAGSRTDDLADYWFATILGTERAVPALVDLAESTRLLDDAIGRLSGSTSKAVLTIDGVRSDNAFETAVATALAAPAAVDTLDVVAAVRTFEDGFAVNAAILDGVEEVMGDLQTLVSGFAADASRDSILTLVVVLALVSSLLLLSILVVMSIERPLGRLIERTRRVGSGDLETERLAIGGPAEIADASAAFNDVVDNLRLLEGKVQALADCDFDDPRLAEPLPGPLGQALAQSVTVLSGSIVDREELQQRLAHQATHDSLTGIPDRAAAIDSLTAALARARRNGTMTAVAFLDLDDFKRANDTFGHGTGDVVLRTVAHRITEHSRAGDYCARLGGDEFIVIAEDVDAIEDAVNVARRIVDAVAEPIDAGGHTIRIGASVGIAISQDADDTPLDLLAKADLAVYRAKRSNQPVELFDESLQEKLMHRARIESALHAELEAGGPNLELHYQPIVHAEDSSLTGFEALVRWRRDGELTPPGDFIPIAEASDLIIELDNWVLRKATAQLAAWRADPALADLDLAVNVSGRHVVHPGFVDDVRDALAGSGVPSEAIVIEVTETVLLDDLVGAARQLEAARELGVRVAVDDFGTGYTSLAHIRRLPIDEIKIDGSFIAELPNADDWNLIRMVTDLARHMGVPTIAEGVETVQQAEILRSIGCDNMQGFHFATPLLPDQVDAWVAEHRPLVPSGPAAAG